MDKKWKSNKLNKRMKAALKETLESYFFNELGIHLEDFIKQNTDDCCVSYGFDNGVLIFNINIISKLPSEEVLSSLPEDYIPDGNLKCEINTVTYDAQITNDTLLKYYK